MRACVSTLVGLYDCACVSIWVYLCASACAGHISNTHWVLTSPGPTSSLHLTPQSPQAWPLSLIQIVLGTGTPQRPTLKISPRIYLFYWINDFLTPDLCHQWAMIRATPSLCTCMIPVWAAYASYTSISFACAHHLFTAQGCLLCASLCPTQGTWVRFTSGRDEGLHCLLISLWSLNKYFLPYGWWLVGG